MRVLALQSGTSADGIDVALVEFAVAADGGERGEGRASASIGGVGIELTPLATREIPWDEGLRREILRAAAGMPMDAGAWCRLDTRLGQAFAAAAWAVLAEAGPADVVVSHGQTVFHWAEPDAGRGSRARGTLQLGEPAWIAERTGLPVISHVRAADIAAGGEGAPLMAVFDRLWLAPLARETGRAVASVNLGGIANVQIVDAAGDVLAFDTGPGNALIDAAVARAAGLPYDADGRFAAAGAVDRALLDALAAHPYFAADPPKTTGRETFDLAVVDAAVAAVHGPLAEVPTADLAATLTELTARTVVDAVAAAGCAELLCSGGGTRNPVLMARIGALAARHGIRSRTTDALGVDPSAKESLLFALVGFCTWHGVPLAVGPTPARLAGRITPGPGPLRMPEPLPGIASLRVVDRRFVE